MTEHTVEFRLPTAPDGYEFTGERRSVVTDDIFLDEDSGEVVVASGIGCDKDFCPHWILRKLPTTENPEVTILKSRLLKAETALQIAEDRVTQMEKRTGGPCEVCKEKSEEIRDILYSVGISRATAPVDGVKILADKLANEKEINNKLNKNIDFLNRMKEVDSTMRKKVKESMDVTRTRLQAALDEKDSTIENLKKEIDSLKASPTEGTWKKVAEGRKTAIDLLSNQLSDSTEALRGSRDKIALQEKRLEIVSGVIEYLNERIDAKDALIQRLIVECPSDSKEAPIDLDRKPL